MTTYREIATDLIKRSEKCVLTGYVHGDNTPTNGWGNTGPGVKVGVDISQAQADYDLDRNVSIADGRLLKAVKPAVFLSLHEHQKAALLDFVYNAGSDPKWQIWKDVNAGQNDLVPHELRRFDHVNGRVDHGLDNRRSAEVVCWNTGDTVLAGQVAMSGPMPPPSGVLRDADTSPRLAAPKTLAKTSLITKIGGLCTMACAAGASHLEQVQILTGKAHDIIAPHASEAPIYGTAVTVLTGIGICIGLISLIIHVDQQKAAAL